jgi:hypothetical protein
MGTRKIVWSGERKVLVDQAVTTTSAGITCHVVVVLMLALGGDKLEGDSRRTEGGEDEADSERPFIGGTLN